MCKVNLVPRIFSLPRSREEERERTLETRLVQGDLSWPNLSVKKLSFFANEFWN